MRFLELCPPYTGPQDDQYDPEEIDRAPNFDLDVFDDQPLQVPYYRGANHRSVADWIGVTTRYWVFSSIVDTHGGRILDTFSRTGRDDETVTIYPSELGTMMGNQGHLNKNARFEKSVRVPLLLRVPRCLLQGDNCRPSSKS